MVEKTYCRVIDIFNNNGNYTARIEFRFPKGELLRDSKPSMFKQLEELDLDHIGAEFYFCAEGTVDKPEVYLEPYILSDEDIAETEALYTELEKLMEN